MKEPVTFEDRLLLLWSTFLLISKPQSIKYPTLS